MHQRTAGIAIGTAISRLTTMKIWRRAAILVGVLFAVCCGRIGTAEAALICTPSGQTVNFGNYYMSSSVTTSQQSSCNGGVANDTVVQCTMFVSNSNGSAGTTGPYYMKNGTYTVNFLLRKSGGSDITTGIWYPQTASLNTSGSATISQLFTTLTANEQGPYPGNYSSNFTVRVKLGSQSTVGADCSGAGVTDSTVIWAFSVYADNGCTISGSTLNFGSTATLSANVDATTTIAANCSYALAYTIALDGGQNGGTSATNRRMANGSNYITYGLYTDAAHTHGWYGATVSNSGSSALQSVTVYGRVPPQTTPAIGTYTDTVVITVTF